MTEMCALSYRAVHFTIGRRRVLDGVDLDVDAGAVVMLVGRNGAGKTTLLRLLLDLVRADAGSVEVFGRSAAAPGVRRWIGYVPETTAHPCGWLSTGDLLAHHARYYRDYDHDYAAQLCARLEVRRDQRFDRLSKGERRRAQLVMALAHRPRLLVLDEPLDGIDPPGCDRALEILAQHLSFGVNTVLWATHRLTEIDALADNVAVLEDGRLELLSGAAVETHVRSYRLRMHERSDLPHGIEVMTLQRTGREAVLMASGREDVISARLRAAGIEVTSVGRTPLSTATRNLFNRDSK